MPADRNAESGSPQSLDDPLSARLKAGRKRRTPGACDYCKKKKVRCDSSEMPGNKCSNCIAVGCDCTHDEVFKTLRNMREYVEVLEGRLKKMDKVLNKAMPGIDVASLWADDSPDEPKNLKEETPVARNDDELDNITSKLISLQLNPEKNYFLGKSSGHQLLQTALEVKDEYVPGLKEKDLWTCKRQKFWDIPSWMTPHPEAEEEPPLYIYPESDLLASLVDAYFTHTNPILPLLHRPTFERSLDAKEHFRDHMFGGTVLLVCALGSRFSNDPRVFVEGSGDTTSAGWKWYNQVHVIRKSLFKRTSLYELQIYALSALYAHSSQVPDGVWPQVGLGLRLAQEVGAHRRRKTKDGRPTAENELWKRAFWVLVVIDRLTSSYSGRTVGIQEEDFDLDLPVDCDDEYWDQGFIQPLGKPSTLSYFICCIKLLDIHAYAMRVIYPIRRPKNLLGKTIHLSEKDIIAELDSAMNAWMDSIPIHLRWNPKEKDPLFAKQSAGLHASYYDLQIFIHRPFIPSPARNPNPASPCPSLAICTNAARLCCLVLDTFNRTNSFILPHLQAASAHSSIILLLNIWSGKKSELAPNPKRDMEDVQKCMKLLKAAEQRWCSAGRYFDVINELACAGELPLPANSPSPSSDHRSDSDFTNFTGNSFGKYSTSSLSSPESTTSSLQYDGTNIPLALQTPEQPMNYSLPVYSADLGNLPIYGQYNFGNFDQAQLFGQNTTSPVAHNPVQMNIPDTSQYFTTDAPMDFIDNGAQNLFAAADFLVKSTLYSGQSQTAYSDTLLMEQLFPQRVTANNNEGKPVGLDEDFEEMSPFYKPSTENSSATNLPGEEATPTSIASSIFAAYDNNWDQWRLRSEVKINYGGRNFF